MRSTNGANSLKTKRKQTKNGAFGKLKNSVGQPAQGIYEGTLGLWPSSPCLLHVRSEMQAKMDGQETPKLIEGSRPTLEGSVDFKIDLRGPFQGWQKYRKTSSFHDYGVQNLVKTLCFPTFLLTVMP